jgi:transcriptional regulator with XRE-family HTH domain
MTGKTFVTKLREEMARHMAVHNLTQVQFAEAAGVSQSNVSNLKTQKSGSSYEHLGKILDALGARIVWPDEMPSDARKVYVVGATTQSSTIDGEAAPTDQDEFLAVPLVGEHSACPGVIAEKNVLGWLMLDRKHESVLRRKDLLAVELSPHSRDMLPTLSPRDIVLVDRGDTEPQPTGRGMYLVRRPGNAGSVLRRVRASAARGDTALTFYTDNLAEYAPEAFSLEKDFGGDMGAAILGHAVWAWSDLTRK